MNRTMMNSWAIAVVLVLAGCATVLPPAPLLKLHPASLGEGLALQQRLTVSVKGATREADALLEVDDKAVRLAVLNLGQTALRMEWNGIELAQTQTPWWPAAISGERILSDLQLMLWPVQAIRPALPDGWSLEQVPSGRELRAPGGQTVVRVAFLSPSQSELRHLRDGYTIRVDSQPQGDAP